MVTYEENFLEIEDDDSAEEEDDIGSEVEFTEYDITASPNDFNIKTIYDFIESGSVIIPSFQRNYVWDITRASKLIESIIIGLPIPQIFLYEKSKNKFLVIDGQQRLMTIYYFITGRFPRKEKRYELRKIFDEKGKFSQEIIDDNEYFTDFKLRLPSKIPDKKNKFDRLSYEMLCDLKSTFDLRTIRNVIIKQNFPSNDDSSIYEIFNRLNSGGVNLKPQEIRMSLYDSEFFRMLHHINLDEKWRKLIGSTEPDLHMKDVEIILRGFAMLIDGNEYKSSMTKFLNKFSKEASSFSSSHIDYLRQLFCKFLDYYDNLDLAYGKGNRINISIYESVFSAVCKKAFQNNTLDIQSVSNEILNRLKSDTEFINATQLHTTNKANVQMRLEKAEKIINSRE